MDELINNTNDDLALGYGDKLADVCRAYVELMTDIRELLKEVEEDKKSIRIPDGWQRRCKR